MFLRIKASKQEILITSSNDPKLLNVKSFEEPCCQFRLRKPSLLLVHLNRKLLLKNNAFSIMTLLCMLLNASDLESAFALRFKQSSDLIKASLYNFISWDLNLKGHSCSD